jgi:hypothetical protein
LEALTIELQEESGDRQLPMEDFSGDTPGDPEPGITMSVASEEGTLTRTNSNATTLGDLRGTQTTLTAMDSVNKINLAEKEKILLECKNQIKVCWHSMLFIHT